MRKREVKVGMPIAHKTTGRYLGRVTELRESIVRFTDPHGNPGIGGYTEIMSYEGVEE